MIKEILAEIGMFQRGIMLYMIDAGQKWMKMFARTMMESRQKRLTQILIIVRLFLSDEIYLLDMCFQDAYHG